MSATLPAERTYARTPWWEQALRTVATGFCFACFGIGGLTLRLCVFPLISLGLRGVPKRQHVARSVIHHGFRLFIWLMKTVRVLTYEVHGLERLQRPGLLVLANHPTLIDVVFLISLMPESDCVVKASLAKNPFTGGPIRAANYICNDAGTALVDDCRTSLEANQCVVIFPEGTRTPRTGAFSFQRGAANVAVRCARAVTPVVIRCEPLALGKGEPWYRIPPRRGHFTITVMPDVDVKPFISEAPSEAVAVRRLNEYLESFFVEEIRRAAT